MFPAGGLQAALSITWQSALQWSLPRQGPAALNVPHCILQLSKVLLLQVTSMLPIDGCMPQLDSFSVTVVPLHYVDFLV